MRPQGTDVSARAGLDFEEGVVRLAIRTHAVLDDRNDPKNCSYPCRASTGGGVGKVGEPTIRRQM